MGVRSVRAIAAPIPFIASAMPRYVPVFFLQWRLIIVPTIVVEVNEIPMPRKTLPTRRAGSPFAKEQTTDDVISEPKPSSISFLVPNLYTSVPKNTFVRAVVINLTLEVVAYALRLIPSASVTGTVYILIADEQKPSEINIISDESITAPQTERGLFVLVFILILDLKIIYE